jgi:LysR family transcriptional regulator, regulator for bpeEF and oprC
MPLSAVYPHNRHLAPKVRVFVEWVAEICAQSPLAFARNRPPIDRTGDDRVVATPSPLPADEVYSDEMDMAVST